MMEAKDTKTRKEKWWYEMGKLDGIREVGEWIAARLYGSLAEGYRLVAVTDEEWQAKLKEWGIETI